MSIYSPSDDSYLILKYAKKYSKGKCLDMGSGSGIIANEMLKFSKDVTSVDINPEVISYLSKNKKLKVIKSDLFSKVKDKFDCIFFNPPYLPTEEPKDLALDGGKEGYEVILRFLKDVKSYLKKEGVLILLISSLSKQKVIDDYLIKNKFKFKQIDKLKLFFEELYIYEIRY